MNAESEQLVRQLCQEVEDRVSRGQQRVADELLVSHPELASQELAAAEVAYSEYAALDDLGSAVNADDFCNRFPQLAVRLRRLIDIHHALSNEPASTLAEPEDTIAGLAESSQHGAEWFPHQQVGQYVLLSILGHGGSGVVYRARQLGLERLVALKLMPKPVAHSGAATRFANEAKAAARLQHPGIVQIHEVGEDQGYLFLSMEYVKGGNLQERLLQPITSKHSCELMIDVARAVQSAHDEGVIHRDLKPANVLLTATGKPKVADFGLAKHLWLEAENDGPSRLTKTGAMIGTPSYMSPEQIAADRAVAPTVDVYGLGAMLYQLLTGRPPFRGDSPMQVFDQIRSDEPVSPRRLNADVSQDVETICLKCLEKMPGQRYQSAADVAEELQRVLDGQPILARPTSTLTYVRRWCQRNAPVAGLIGLAGTLLLTMAIGGSLLGWRQASLRRDAEAARASENEQSSVRKSISDFIIEAFQAPSPTRDGRTVTVAEMLANARIRMDEQFPQASAEKVALLRTIADTYISLGLYDEATSTAEAAVVASQQHYGAQHEESVRSRLVLAKSLVKGGNSADFAMLDRLVRDVADALGEGGREHLQTLTTQASALSQADRDKESLPILKAAHDLAQAHHGIDSTLATETSSEYAIGLVNAGNVSEARALIDELLTRTRASLGENDLRVLQLELIQASTLKRMGQLDEAIQLLQHAAEGRRAVLGPEHPDTVTALNNLAVAYSDAGRLKESLKLGQKVYEIRKTILGENNRLTVASQSNIAFLLFNLNLPQEALPVVSNVIDRYRQILGEDHTLTLNAERLHAGCLMELGENEQAVEMLERVLSQLEHRHGEDHAACFQARDALILAYAKAGQHDQGLELGMKHLADMEHRFGRDHIRTLHALDGMCKLHRLSGELEKGLELTERATAVGAKLFGRESSQTRALFINLATCQSELGRMQACAETLREQLEVDQQIDSASYRALDTQRQLGTVLTKLEEYDEAKRLLTKSIEQTQKMPESDSPDGRNQLLEGMKSLIVCCEKTNDDEGLKQWRATLEGDRDPK